MCLDNLTLKIGLVLAYNFIFTTLLILKLFRTLLEIFSDAGKKTFNKHSIKQISIFFTFKSSVLFFKAITCFLV